MFLVCSNPTDYLIAFSPAFQLNVAVHSPFYNCSLVSSIFLLISSKHLLLTELSKRLVPFPLASQNPSFNPTTPSVFFPYLTNIHLVSARYVVTLIKGESLGMPGLI